jgi:hypothetical protein
MGNLLQVLVDTSLTVTETFTVDGAAIDVDSGLPTLTATYPSGAALSPVPTVSNSWTGRTTGQYRWVLDPEPEVTWLDYELTGTIGGKTQKLKGRVEWLGNQLFTIADLRSYSPLGSSDTPFSDSAKFPDKELHRVRAAVLAEFTHKLRYSPVPRYEREVLSVAHGRPVLVKRLFATQVLAVTVGGVAQTASDYYLDGVTLLPVSGYVAGPWTSYGSGALAVAYRHGNDEPLEGGDGRDVALMRASMKLLPGPGSTVTSYSSPDGGVYSWDRVGSRNAAGEQVHFGVGAIAEWINDHRMADVAVA